jgi:hypothetical protein
MDVWRYTLFSDLVPADTFCLLLRIYCFMPGLTGRLVGLSNTTGVTLAAILAGQFRWHGIW